MTACDPDCAKCPKLCKGTMNVCMEGDGPLDAQMMILGEAPGATEDEKNRPFVGQAGSYLRDELLISAKVPEDRVRFSNAVRCHPPKNRTPKVSELSACREYLVAEVERLRPRVIVAMGNAPLTTLLRSFFKVREAGVAGDSEAIVGGISRWQGKTVWSRELNCWIAPTYHPSYCMRNERAHSLYSSDLVVEDLHRAWKLANRSPVEMSYPRIEVVASPVRVPAILSAMESAGAFAFDIETSGTGRYVDKGIIGCSFCSSKDAGYYIPWEYLAAPKSTYMQFYRLIAGSDTLKVMHNGAYEIRVMRGNGIPIGMAYYDTMVAVHLLDENFGKGLKDNAWLYTNFGGYDYELEAYKAANKIKEDYGKIPKALLDKYAAYDAVATWVVYEKTLPELKEQSLHNLFSKIVMPVRKVMSCAELRGICVDKGRAVAVEGACIKALDSLEKRIYKVAGHEFNISSPLQLSKVLYGELKLTPTKKTKSGWSVDAASVAKIGELSGHEIADLLMSRAYIGTLLRTHVRQAIDHRWEEDGRVHTSYNLTGAVTGRTSCSQPSLQNVPQDRLVRSIYTSSPGCLLVEADLKSAELAVLAAVSGETMFINAFRDGLDLHSETYRTLYDLPSDYECTKLERRKAKTINFGLVYGLTALGMAERLSITVEEAAEFIDLYFEKLPRVATWMESQKALVRENGYVVSVFGRRRRIPYAVSDKWGDLGRAERQAMNAPIQSGAADYTYVGLIRLHAILARERLDARIVHTVHDCVLVDTPVAEVDMVSACVRAAFETPVKAMPIQMQIDIEIGKSWGEANESRLQDIFDGLQISL